MQNNMRTRGIARDKKDKKLDRFKSENGIKRENQREIDEL